MKILFNFNIEEDINSDFNYVYLYFDKTIYECSYNINNKFVYFTINVDNTKMPDAILKLRKGKDLENRFRDNRHNQKITQRCNFSNVFLDKENNNKYKLTLSVHNKYDIESICKRFLTYNDNSEIINDEKYICFDGEYEI